MFFAIIGIGVFCYGIVYTLLICFLDCDLQLAFHERFGKSIRKLLCMCSSRTEANATRLSGRLKGKVVFITGASSGIGEHIAVALARHGVKLVISARRRDELERVKRNCIGKRMKHVRRVAYCCIA